MAAGLRWTAGQINQHQSDRPTTDDPCSARTRHELIGSDIWWPAAGRKKDCADHSRVGTTLKYTDSAKMTHSKVFLERGAGVGKFRFSNLLMLHDTMRYDTVDLRALKN